MRGGLLKEKQQAVTLRLWLSVMQRAVFLSCLGSVGDSLEL